MRGMEATCHARQMAETKAANLRLEASAYGLLHYLSAIEGRAKSEIVEEALRDYSVNHTDRVSAYTKRLGEMAGVPIPVPLRGDSAGTLASRVKARTASGGRRTLLPLEHRCRTGRHPADTDRETF